MSSPLAAVVSTWESVRAVAGRLAKRRRMAELFAQLSPTDLRLAASYLSGEIPQVTTGVGWSLLSDAFAHASQAATPAGEPPTLDEVDACFTTLAGTSGPGANRRRIETLGALLGRASPAERELLGALLLGELRQGALRALVMEAIAEAYRLDVDELRRAVMYAGQLGAVAVAVASEGPAALARFQLTPLIPVEPMLATTAESLASALADLGGTAAVEWKLDGVRVQLHRKGDEVRAFTRSLRDVTEGSTELRQLALSLPAESFILDGEMISFAHGRPLPFQDLMSRFSTEDDAGAGMEVFFFDLLFLDGVSLVARPDRERRAALEQLVGARAIPRTLVASADEASAALEIALANGHEGVMLKAHDAPYAAGRRGGLWQKLKPAHTLDLVILAAEWGHGRRRGWLSNLHLGARDPLDPTRFWMLGKTFKGLTDAMLRELTVELRALAVSEDDHVVHVRPERVVEIAFDGVQRSSRYDSGMALRFARVKRFRPDKRAADATTVDEIRALVSRVAAAPKDPSPWNRRDAMKTLLLGGAAVAHAACTANRRTAMTDVLPVLFIAHGAPPLLDDPTWVNELHDWARALPAPKAVLMISAHWEERPLTLGATTAVPLVYDFYGFPERYYQVKYPSPGAPALAARVRDLLSARRIAFAEENGRGLDHGAYVPLVCMYPAANVPVLQISLPSLDPVELFAVGQALAPLRQEGVLIVGSGFLTHNMRYAFRPGTPAWAREFDDWSADVLARRDFDALVDYQARAPAVRMALPTTEHFVPVVVAAGAAALDTTPISFPITGWWMDGAFTRRSVQFG